MTETIPDGTPAPPSKQEQQACTKSPAEKMADAFAAYDFGAALTVLQEHGEEMVRTMKRIDVDLLKTLLERIELGDVEGARLRLRAELRMLGVRS